MQLKTLAAVVAFAITLGVQAAPNAFDAAAGLKDAMKRSYSHGMDMSKISKRAMTLVARKKRQPNRHRRFGKRCIAPNPSTPTSTPAQTVEATPEPQPTTSSSSTSPSPSPEPTQDSNNNGNNSNNDSGSGNTAPSDLAQQFLDAHNTARANHGAAALTWSDQLANAAQSWANACNFKHSGGSLGPFGENLAAQTGSLTPAQAVQFWMDEASDYDPGNPQFSHFTQVVWKGSTQLGCAIAACAPGTIFASNFGTSYYAVCEYNPAGNVIGQFAENVQK